MDDRGNLQLCQPSNGPYPGMEIFGLAQGDLASALHEPAVKERIGRENLRDVIREKTEEFESDRKFTQIWLPHSLEPKGLLCGLDADKGKGFTAIELLEIGKLNAERQNRSPYPLLKPMNPAKTAEWRRVSTEPRLARLRDVRLYEIYSRPIRQVVAQISNRTPCQPNGCVFLVSASLDYAAVLFFVTRVDHS